MSPAARQQYLQQMRDRYVVAKRAVSAGYPWSVRLQALLPVWLPKVRAHLPLTPAEEKQLRQVSPRQMDRLLQADKRQVRRRLYGRTKPGTLLKQHVPLRTDRWDVTTPGRTEVDLVAHSGDRAKVAALVALRARLDPSVLAARIDRLLEGVCALAHHRTVPGRGTRPVDGARSVDARSAGAHTVNRHHRQRLRR